MAFLATLLTRQWARPLNHQSGIIRHQCLLSLQPSCSKAQWQGLSTDASRRDFGGGNAYELLGVSEASSFAEIKASFRKLAKETHPDLAEPKDSSASQRFIQILAAYEVLNPRFLLNKTCCKVSTMLNFRFLLKLHNHFPVNLISFWNWEIRKLFSEEVESSHLNFESLTCDRLVIKGCDKYRVSEAEQICCSFW